MRTLRLCLAAVVLTSLLAVSGASSGRAAAASTTVKGYVIDSACTFTKHLKKPISADCAVACAKAGSPLVIQTEDGTIYWPISSDTPAAGQNDKLMSYAGKMVSVTGTVYTKGGSRAIVISKVEAADSSK